MKKEIILIRHAKSDWSMAEEIPDLHRGLSRRGYEQAPLLGPLLQLYLKPQTCRWYSSPALRAYATALLIFEALNRPIEQELILNKQLYHASAQTTLLFLKTLDETCEQALLIGHNPGWEEFCRAAGMNGLEKFPTSAFAHFSYMGLWSNLNFEDLVPQALVKTRV